MLFLGRGPPEVPPAKEATPPEPQGHLKGPSPLQGTPALEAAQLFLGAAPPKQLLRELSGPSEQVHFHLSPGVIGPPQTGTGLKGWEGLGLIFSSSYLAGWAGQLGKHHGPPDLLCRSTEDGWNSTGMPSPPLPIGR